MASKSRVIHAFMALVQLVARFPSVLGEDCFQVEGFGHFPCWVVRPSASDSSEPGEKFTITPRNRAEFILFPVVGRGSSDLCEFAHMPGCTALTVTEARAHLDQVRIQNNGSVQL